MTDTRASGRFGSETVRAAADTTRASSPLSGTTHARGETVPTWVTAPGGPLAVQVHLPYGEVCSGAVVMVPPVGLDEVISHRSVRALADELAGSGYVVLRAHLSGLGESGDGARDCAADVALRDRWLGDVAALHRFARREVGATAVHLIGVGMGATIAALACVEEAAASGEVDGTTYASLVLIDPVGCGRRWLARQRDRHATTCSPLASTRDGVSMPGLFLRPDDALSVEGLTLPSSWFGSTTRVLVLDREDAPADADVTAFAAAAGADTRPAADLSVAFDARSATRSVPHATWRHVREWLSETTAEATGLGAFAARASAEVTADGVWEEFVEVAGRPGVLTHAAGPARQALVVVSATGDPRGGPGGHGWVTLARRAARLGVTTLRLDPSTAETSDAVGYCSSAVEEYVAAAEWMRVRLGLWPVVVGHREGAWTALMTAHRAPVTRAISLAQHEWRTDAASSEAAGTDGSPLKQPRTVPWLVSHAPYPALLHLGRTRPLPTPQAMLERATRRGVACDLYVTDAGRRRFVDLRGEDAIRHLERAGARISARHETRGDRDLLDPEALERAIGYVLERALVDVPLPGGGRRSTPRRRPGRRGSRLAPSGELGRDAQLGLSNKLVTEPSSKTS